MTPEEREAYVSQDEARRNWREIPASDRIERLGAEETLADLLRPGFLLPKGGPLRAALDPVEAECLCLFYGEGKTYGQIARMMSTQHVVAGRVVKTRPFTKNMVKKLLSAARKNLLRNLPQPRMSGAGKED